MVDLSRYNFFRQIQIEYFFYFFRDKHFQHEKQLIFSVNISSFFGCTPRKGEKDSAAVFLITGKPCLKYQVLPTNFHLKIVPGLKKNWGPIKPGF